ncbi:MAG: mechanosensitive ion channel family protein [Acidimicrobiia bacterium]|nr:mechanosensitive ion channel family protein [Acidimicrobiia bacterium]
MRTWIEDTLGISADIAYRLTATVVVLVVLVVLRWLVARWIGRKVTEPELMFRARKTVSYVATTIFVLAMSWVWLPFFDDLGTFLGLLAAGLAIALADVFLDIAGWLFIVFRRPFKVGDRIEINGTAGDVIDLRVFRFTVLEIRNWVDADQSTGRVVHIPNGHLFKYPTANFTEGFFHIWHEVPVAVTFESDWKRAEELVLEAMAAVAIDEEELRRHQRIRSTTRDYMIKFQELKPTVYVSTTASGVVLTGRLLVEARARRGIEDAVWRSLLTAIVQEPTVELAYPTGRTVVVDPIRIQRAD